MSICYLPRILYSSLAQLDSTNRETTSPILAANGVAKLSGFNLILCDKNMTDIKIKSGK